MKVSIELSTEYRIPYAVIYADKMTDEISEDHGKLQPAGNADHGAAE